MAAQRVISVEGGLTAGPLRILSMSLRKLVLYGTRPTEAPPTPPPHSVGYYRVKRPFSSQPPPQLLYYYELDSLDSRCWCLVGTDVRRDAASYRHCGPI